MPRVFLAGRESAGLSRGDNLTDLRRVGRMIKGRSQSLLSFAVLLCSFKRSREALSHHSRCSICLSIIVGRSLLFRGRVSEKASSEEGARVSGETGSRAGLETPACPSCHASSLGQLRGSNRLRPAP